MNQTRLVSLIEAALNTASGFVIAMLVWQLLVAPLFGYEVTARTNFAMTSIFTAVSVVRSYAWRRFFARGLHVVLLRWINAHTPRR
jgi:hypothetical protein